MEQTGESLGNSFATGTREFASQEVSGIAICHMEKKTGKLGSKLRETEHEEHDENRFIQPRLSQAGLLSLQVKRATEPEE